MRAVFRTATLLVSLGAVLPAAARAQANPDWHRGIPGFRIAGNLYYVGTADLAAYLIATPQGNILINGNFKEDVHFGFEVKNLRAVLAELKAKGVKMAFDMRDNPGTAFAFISDNAGNAIELIEHKAPR